MPEERGSLVAELKQNFTDTNLLCLLHTHLRNFKKFLNPWPLQRKGRRGKEGPL